MLKMHLLGVGTAVPDVDRENTHMVFESNDGLLLVDAGGSTWQRLLRARLDPLSLNGLVLSHGHPDHINGVPALLFQLGLLSYGRRLPIYANQETISLLQRIVAAFEMDQYACAVDWVVVKPGDPLPLATTAYRVLTAETVHQRPALALRFEAPDGRSLVYPADTEPCPAVERLAQGATILIHEATTAGPWAGHTSPRQLGEIAVRAGVKRLILVHFSPRYTMSAAQAIDEVRAAGFEGSVEIGREFDVLSL